MSAVAGPNRTFSEAAYARSLAVRQAHGLIRAEVHTLPYREGLALVAEMLEHPTGGVLSMRADVLLCSICEWGRRCPQRGAGLLADHVLASVGVHRARVRVGELTDRQRHALADRLRSMAQPREASDA